MKPAPTEAEDCVQLLLAARRQTEVLLADLRRQQAELGQRPAHVDDGSWEAGRRTLQAAIDSASRMVESISAALAAECPTRKENHGTGTAP